ncbi:DUF418 domain-containing protein [Agilicoccus flavus]|uniref:DUF418 domain-containing protein n=1 Tax=Agilicoccus flavus TaxID=2775968 RepID=UPI0027D9DF48|nr:DUF418 domain-containing protein [Agilicoccus flavus]
MSTSTGVGTDRPAAAADRPVDGPAPTEADVATSTAREGRRLVALDVLRGIAILGTFGMNVGVFLSGDSGGSLTPFDDAIGTALGLVTDGKFIGLLTIMFGIGLEIQRRSAVRRGETWLGSYPWRAALLVLDGLLNYVFLVEYDVLMGYGITGLIVCVVLVASPRVQAWVMGLGLAAHVAYLTYMSLPMWGASAVVSRGTVDLLHRDPASLTPAQVQQAAAELGLPREEVLRIAAENAGAAGNAAGTDPGAVAAGAGLPGPGAGTTTPTDSYWAGVTGRVDNFWEGRGEIPIMILMGLGLFLVGAHLYRAGLFEERGAQLRRWVMILAFGVGLPLDWGTRLWLSEYTMTFNRYLTSTLVSFGLLAVVAAFYAGGRRPGLVGRAVSNVGTMALTCYIGQNLIASVLFYDWGFGLARHMTWGCGTPSSAGSS